MVRSSLCHYLDENFTQYKEKITKLSQSDAGVSLVVDEREIYNFDKITEKLYENELSKKPSSADAVAVTPKCLMLVEFKTGFKSKFSAKKLNRNLLKCPYDGSKICDEYGKLLLINRNYVRNELYDSVRLKAIESYMTLKKKISSAVLRQEETLYVPIIYCVVIDEPLDDMEDTLLELAKKDTDDNAFVKMRRSLKRLIDVKSSDKSENFYYDEIKVLSPYCFKEYLSKVKT